MKFVAYFALRLGVFALAFILAMWMYPNYIFAAIIGLIFSFAVAYLAAPKLRRDATAQVADVFTRERPSKPGQQELADADAEDAYTAGKFYEATPADITAKNHSANNDTK